MRAVLTKYLNKTIGINPENPFRIESAQLTHLGDDYFSILDSKKGYTHHFSYSSIVQIIENPDGIDVGGFFTHKEIFDIVVKVGHLYKYVPA
jgi:hypothetical protein